MAGNGFNGASRTRPIGSSLRRQLSWDWKFNIAAWRHSYQGLYHRADRRLDTRPAGCAQHNNGDLSTRKVLLIPEILVGRNQNIKAALFGLLQQLAIFQMAPPEFVGGRDLMGR